MPAEHGKQAQVPAPETAFTIETLSRGKGVPPQVDDALERLRAYVEAERTKGIPASITTTGIGLEGETRTCVVYRASDAGRKAYEYAQILFGGQELVNLKLGRCEPNDASK